MNKKQRLLKLIDEILFYMWDPIGVSNNILCRDEYSSYVSKICSYVLEEKDEAYIVAHLKNLEISSIGLKTDDQYSEKDLNHLLKVASILLKCKECV